MKEFCGQLWQQTHFSMNHLFARVHNNFLYLYNTQSSETPSSVLYLEKTTCKLWVMRCDGMCRLPVDTPKNPKYFGFRVQFPAAYDRDFYTTSEEDRLAWVKAIQDVSGVRKIEDYYDICEKIGEGRFAEVYRVGVFVIVFISALIKRRRTSTR